MRKRRLTEIIKRMRQDVPISETAFEYGFNSKENFTRAFISEHHILPTEYKKALNSLKLYEAISFAIQPFEVLPELTYLETFDVIAYNDENCPPNFWNKYNSRKWSKKLSGGKVCEDYGISAWNESENKLDYFIGILEKQCTRKYRRYGRTFDTEAGYTLSSRLPTSHYDFVNTIHRTWDYINNKWLQNSGYRRKSGYEFELYVEESRTYSEKIYIPLEG